MTSQPQSQAEILEILAQDNVRYADLLHRFSDADLQRPFTPEGWSVNDFLAHMTYWKDATRALLVAYLHDQPLPPVIPSGDTPNEEVRRQFASRTLEDIKNDWEETHSHLVHIVSEEFDGQRIVEEVRAPWDEGEFLQLGQLVAGTCEHDTEHFDLIEQYQTKE